MDDLIGHYDESFKYKSLSYNNDKKNIYNNNKHINEKNKGNKNNKNIIIPTIK